MKEMKIRTKSEYDAVFDYFLIGDEYGNSYCYAYDQISEIYKDAQKFGIPCSRVIPGLDGEAVKVTALPVVRKHSWSF